MTPHKQLFLHDPPRSYGDCYRTAIGCVLDLRPEEVPHFCDGGEETEEDWARVNAEVRAWLAPRGLVLVAVPFTGEDVGAVLAAFSHYNPGLYFLLTGESRNGTNHVVVCRDGAIVHDPSLDGSGVVGPAEHGLYFVEAFADRRFALETPSEPDRFPNPPEEATCPACS